MFLPWLKLNAFIVFFNIVVSSDADAKEAVCNFNVYGIRRRKCKTSKY